MWVFQTGDIEEAYDFQVRQYADNRMTVTRTEEPFQLRVARREASAYYFDDYYNTSGARYSCDPAGHLIICRVRSGRYERTNGTDVEQFGAGQFFLANDLVHPWAAQLSGLRLHILGLNTQVVARVAGVDRFNVEGVRPVSPALTRRWDRVMDFVAADAFQSDDETSEHPLVSAGVSQLLAAVFLSVFPTDVPMGPTALDRRDAHPRTLRRAIAFIEANPDRDISVSEIAQAASVTARSIQLAFRRYLGTTPTAYLKVVRLHQARRDLLAADPARGDRVMAVAGRWGFTSMSRFAADYRIAFGESPSLTLRRVAGR